jgi:perosamine synthetase
MNSKICIYEPLLKDYKKSAIEAIESEWISNHGKFIGLSTDLLKNILNVKHVILMANGTCATHCNLIALKYKYPGIKKIYVPNNCYVAVYNCVLMEYTKEEIEVLEIDEETWNMRMDDEYLLSLEKNSAIMVVHNLGGIVNVNRIKKIRPDIILMEDNCEGLFGKYHDIYTGTSNDILSSSISFYGNKTITSGEGGAFITNDDSVYEYIKGVYSQGMSSKRYVHHVHAYNYRMTNIQAGFLYDQLNDLEHILSLKKKVFKNYEDLLKDLIDTGFVKIQKIEEDCERSYWIFALHLVNNKMNIDELFNYFENKNGIEIRPFFYPIYEHLHLKDMKLKNEENIKISKKLNENIIMIPSYPLIEYEKQKYIVEKIKELCEI